MKAIVLVTRWTAKKRTVAPVVVPYERNEIKPTIETAKNIADALDITIDYLFGSSDKMIIDKQILNRLEEVGKLPKNEKTKVLDYIDLVIRNVKTKQAYKAA